MDVPGVSSLSGVAASPSVFPLASSSKPAGAADIARQFGDVLEKAVENLDQQEKNVQKLNQQFIVGQLSDVHSLMIASEKAQLGLQLTVQVRNKVIEAYQEIMRTQL